MLSTLSRRLDFSGADGQQIQLTAVAASSARTRERLGMFNQWITSSAREEREQYNGDAFFALATLTLLCLCLGLWHTPCG